MPLIQGRGPPSDGMSRPTMAGSTKAFAAATRLRCAWTSSHASRGRIQSPNKMLGFSQNMVILSHGRLLNLVPARTTWTTISPRPGSRNH